MDLLKEEEFEEINFKKAFDIHEQSIFDSNQQPDEPEELKSFFLQNYNNNLILPNRTKEKTHQEIHVL